MRRLQNFAKSSPYFWLTLHRTKVRWRFRKIFGPSQNIWTLLLFCMALHKSNRTELTEWQNVRRDLIKRFIFFTTWKFLDCLMSACLVSGVSKSGLMHVKYTADKILSDSPISLSDLVVKVNVIWPDFVIFFQWNDLFVWWILKSFFIPQK